MEDRFKDLVRSLTKRSTAATVEATDEVCDRSGEDEDQAVCSKDCDVVPAEHVSRAMAKLPAPKLLTRIREKTPQGKVKDPEQTPTKATDSAKESAAKRGKGRPTKDRFAQLRTGMKELRDAGAASRKFFGGEWKNVSRNWAKYILAIDQQIEEEQDESMLPELEGMAKKSRVALTVLNAILKFGLATEEACKVYVEQVAYCQLPPRVENPFPDYLREVMLSTKASTAWPASAFLSATADGELAEFGEGSTVEDMQMDLFAEKLMTFAGEADVPAVGKKLAQLCTSFEDAVRAQRFTKAPLLCEMCHLSNLTIQERMEGLEADEIDASVAHLTTDSKFSKALRGKATKHIFKKAQDVAKEKRAAKAARSEAREDLKYALPCTEEGNKHLHCLSSRGVTLRAKDEHFFHSVFEEAVLNDIFIGVFKKSFELIFEPGAGSWVVPTSVLGSTEFKILKCRLEILGDDSFSQCFEVIKQQVIAAKKYSKTLDLLLRFIALTPESIDSIEPGVARHVFTSLSSFESDSPEVIDMFKSACGPTASERVCYCVKGMLSTPLGEACKASTRSNVDPVLVEVVQTCSQVFKDCVALDKADDPKLRVIAECTWPADIPKLLGTLNALKMSPDCNQLYKEIQFIAAFTSLASAYAVVAIDRRSNPDRSGRKIREERISQLCDLRVKLKSMQSVKGILESKGFMELKPKGSEHILPPGALEDTLQAIQDLVSDILNGWQADMNDLCKLVFSYMPPTWRVFMHEILQEKNAEILKAVLNLENTQKAGKGAALISSWRAELKKISMDGCGVVFDPALVTKWTQARNDAMDYVTFSSACQHVVHDLPGIKNKALRVKSAKSFMENADLDQLGTDLKDRLSDFAKEE